MNQINIAIITETHNANLIFKGQNDISNEIWEFFSSFEYGIDYETHTISFYGLQTKTSILLGNLLIYAKQVNKKEIWSLYRILEEMKDGSKFYLFPVNEMLSDEIVHKLQMQLFELNNKDAKEFLEYYEENLSRIMQEYQLIAYDNSKCIYIGEPDKTKRVCRFCGKMVPETSFKLKAHTISEALGNKHIVTNDECDICNGKFGRGIEQDLINYIQPLLTFFGVNGKNGVPKIKDIDESFTIEETKDDDRSKIEIKLYQKEDKTNEQWTFEESEGTMSLSFPGQPVNVQNVYRAIVKYAIGILPENQLVKFEDTIEWIQGKTTYTDLPRVVFFLLNSVEQSDVGIKLFIRKTDNKELPYSFVFLDLQGLCILAILPLSFQDDKKFDVNGDWNNFWKFINPLCSRPVLKVLNPNKDLKEDMTFNFNFVQRDKLEQ